MRKVIKTKETSPTRHTRAFGSNMPYLLNQQTESIKNKQELRGN